MADLSLGLVGLALLPTLFFFISLKLTEEERLFKVAFSGMGFITVFIFLGYSATFLTDAAPIWGLFAGFFALFIIYMWVEGINIILSAANTMLQKFRRG